MASFTLTGLDQMIRNLERVGGNIGQASARPLKQEAETVMTDSKANYVPVQDGILRNSGYVADPIVSGSSCSVEMGYGGAAAAYALVQHERLDFKHPHGKQPKYLERPLMAAAHGMDVRLAKTLMDEIERLIGHAT